MAAKRTAELIPLCHPAAADQGRRSGSSIDDGLPGLSSRRRADDRRRTGVEMEALTAVSVACLTLFDMLKAIDRTMVDRRNRSHLEDRRQVGRLAQDMISFDEAIELDPLDRKAARNRDGRLAKRRRPSARAAGHRARSIRRARMSRRWTATRFGPKTFTTSGLAEDRRRVVRRQRPGRATVEAGSCVRIFTGAPVPAGADRVVIQEDVRREGDLAIIDEAAGSGRLRPPARRRFQGGRQSFCPSGDCWTSARSSPPALPTSPKSRFGAGRACMMLATGDELAEPGTARDRPDAVPDSVSLGVALLAERWGRRCVGRETAARRSAVDGAGCACARCERADLVVVTGGASVGEKDFAKAMFEPAGLELVFSKVAIKPGKPAWLGRVGRAAGDRPSGQSHARRWSRRGCCSRRCLPGCVGRRSTNSALDWASGSACDGAARMRCPRDLSSCAPGRWRSRGPSPSRNSSAQKALAEADVLVRQAANCAGDSQPARRSRCCDPLLR